MIGGGLPTPATPPSLGYVGQWGVYTDQETRPTNSLTGLPLVGVRYYDPITGRFPARDPIGDGINWYSYANGNPVKFMDPEGLRSTGTYLGDVGQVFVGYGNVLNPINAVRSGVQLYQVARKDGVKTAGKAAWQGVKSGYTTWLTTSDPTAFGESFGTVLTTAAAVAAPYAKAGVGAKVASAERLAATERAAADTSTALVPTKGTGGVILGRRITLHAAQAMEARGVSSSMVGAALRKGTRFWDPKSKTVNYVLQTARGRYLEVGINPVTRSIAHVFPFAKKINNRFIKL